MRWIVRILVAALAGIAVLIGGLFLLPGDRVGAVVSRQVEAATGRTLDLPEGFRPTLWPVIGLRTGRVALANADWSADGPMLQAEGMSVALDLAAALAGRIEITSLLLDGPRLVLERHADGRTNWQFGRDQAPSGGDGGATAAEGGGLAAFSLAEARIRGGSFLWIDHGAGSREELEGVDLVAQLPQAGGRLSLAIEATRGGQSVTGEIVLDSLAATLEGRVAGITAALDGTFGRARFDGRAGLSPLVAEGRIEAELRDVRAAAALAGAAAPSLPAGLAPPYALEANVTVTPEASLHLRAARLRFGGQEVSLEADLRSDGPRPHLTARVTAGTLRLPGAAGAGGGAAAAGGAGEAGWPRTPIDASALGLLDGEVSFTATALELGSLRMAPVSLRATLERARLVVGLRDVGLHGGRVTGEVVANNRSGFSTGGEVRVEGIALQPVLTALAGYDRLVGTGSGSLRFLGVGGSVDAIMRSLSGAGSIELGAGEILGLDLAGMIRNLDASYRGAGARTVYDRVTAGFTIENGVARNDDLHFQSPVLSARGAGTVDLGRQTIDYTITPDGIGGRDGQGGVVVPVRLTGPWSNVRYAPDLDALVRPSLDRAREDIEAEARRRIEEELRRRVPDAPEGASPEELLRRGVESEAQRALERMLGLPPRPPAQ